jgi:uncharacterized PurR-regulated membrane protein YhhQ (DUF165 family)
VQFRTLYKSLTRVGLALLGGYVASILLANWLVLNFGLDTGNGVRTIPVWLGVEAPSGVLAAGATLTLRDALQRAHGVRATLLAILCGSFLSALISPTVALASGLSFLVAELLDLSVYTPLRRRFVVAVVVSNLVGSLVDSLMFLTLAFGTSVALAFAGPSVLGKLEASIVTLGLLGILRVFATSQREGRLDMPIQ